MDKIIGFFIVLFFLGVAFTLIEKRFAANKHKKVFRKSWKLDFFYFLFNPSVGEFLKKASAFIVIVPLYILVVGEIPTEETFQQGFGPLGAQPLWLQAIQILVIADFIGYWTHRRLFHTSPRYWKIHAVHHSSENLDWLASARLHPLNEIINTLVFAVPLVLLGWSPISVASITPFLILHGLMLHANVNWTYGKLRYVISSPVFHRWHHTKINEGGMKNFAGLFPIWDILFGTFYMPKGQYPQNFGIDENMPESFKGQMLYPFKKNL